MRRRTFLVPALFSLLLAACAESSPPADAENDLDASEDATDDGRATPAPHGPGVCCTIRGSGCSPGDLSVGGWAPSASECHGGGYDGAPYTISLVDDHGCPYLGGNTCVEPCGSADPTWTPPDHCTP